MSPAPASEYSRPNSENAAGGLTRQRFGIPGHLAEIALVQLETRREPVGDPRLRVQQIRDGFLDIEAGGHVHHVPDRRLSQAEPLISGT